MRALPLSFIVVLTIMSVASGFVDLRTRSYPVRSYTEFIPRVVDGTADAPERYRVLVPFTLDAAARITGLNPAPLWHASRLALFWAAYVLFFVYLQTWVRPHEALLGTAVVAATLPLTFTNSWAHPDHIAELALFTAGCLAIARQKTAWLFVVLAAATLNRETAVFLVPLFFLAAPISRQRILLTGLLLLEWGAIYAGLRFWRGFQHYEYWQIGRNLEFLRLLPENYDPYYRAYAYFGIVLFGSLMALAMSRARNPQPLFVRRALWVVPMIAGVAFAISSIIESRIFTPLYPLLMPAVMFSLLPADRSVSPASLNERHA